MNMVGRMVIAAGAAAFVASAASAQDPVKVDPRHYKVASRIRRFACCESITGRMQTSVMHSHPDGVVTYLSAGRIKFLLPDGKTITSSAKAGQTMWAPGGPHKPTNLGNKPFDAVLVELKGGHSKK